MILLSDYQKSIRELLDDEDASEFDPATKALVRASKAVKASRSLRRK